MVAGAGVTPAHLPSMLEMHWVASALIWNGAVICKAALRRVQGAYYLSIRSQGKGSYKLDYLAPFSAKIPKFLPSFGFLRWVRGGAHLLFLLLQQLLFVYYDHFLLFAFHCSCFLSIRSFFVCFWQLLTTPPPHPRDVPAVEKGGFVPSVSAPKIGQISAKVSFLAFSGRNLSNCPKFLAQSAN